MSVSAVIALGSNEGQKMKALTSALSHIDQLPNTRIQKTSHAYSSEPWGFESDNSFLNAVCTIETQLSVGSLLLALQRIEKDLGRTLKSSGTYTDRIIDLDIIFYGQLVLSANDLVIPHRFMPVRNFVLQPLAEIAPNWIHPLYLTSVEDLLKHSTDKSTSLKVNAL